jgi:hypothetical protein
MYVVIWTQKFYEDRGQTIEKVIFPAELWQSNELESKLKEYLKLNVMNFKKLEADHRNLVQHCLTMQKEIKYRTAYLETTNLLLNSATRWRTIYCQSITLTSSSWFMKLSRSQPITDISAHKIIAYRLIVSEWRRSSIARKLFLEKQRSNVKNRKAN